MVPLGVMLNYRSISSRHRQESYKNTMCAIIIIIVFHRSLMVGLQSLVYHLPRSSGKIHWVKSESCKSLSSCAIRSQWKLVGVQATKSQYVYCCVHLQLTLIMMGRFQLNSIVENREKKIYCLY